MIAARARFWFRLLISAALIGLLLTKINWPGLRAVLFRISIADASRASLLTLPLILLLAARWRIFLRQQTLEASFGTVLGLTWTGQFFNSILPGSTGGDVVKIYQLCRMFPEKKAAAAVSVIVDRFTALIALAILAGLALINTPLPQIPAASLSLRAIYLWLAVALLLAFLGASLGLRFLRRSPHWLARLRHVASVLRTSFTLNTQMALAVGLALFVHLLNFGILFGFARALGIAITYPQVLSFMPIVFAMVLVPVTVNGHGLREVLLVFYFIQLNISLSGAGIGPAETAVSLSLVTVVNDLLWALPGGLWYLISLRRLRAMPSSPKES